MKTIKMIIIIFTIVFIIGFSSFGVIVNQSFTNSEKIIETLEKSKSKLNQEIVKSKTVKTKKTNWLSILSKFILLLILFSVIKKYTRNQIKFKGKEK